MLNFKPKPAALAVSIACFALAAHAADENSGESATTLQEVLQEVKVKGSKRGVRDRAGKARVYDNDMSTVYAGKEDIERFKGAAPADIFKGMVGVQSGDARNSGALDPNIRGIQGQGRVPVTVDGTEQAITVWRGYNGANNRNYIDPMLIGGMTVEKGPALTRDVANSVGGGVAIKTLDADDILPEGKDFGIDMKIEASTGSARPRWPSMQQGVKVQTGFLASDTEINYDQFFDPDTLRYAKHGGRYTFGKDQAMRFAIAKRWNDFDLMAAYVWRHKGDHYSGKNGSKYYNTNPNTEDQSFDYTRYLAQIYQPRTEVPNTSSDMKSLLLKTTWRPTPYQQLQLGWRDTRAEYGEIMPSRLGMGRANIKGLELRGSLKPGDRYTEFLKRYDVANTVTQWPSSTVHTQAVNLDYKWKPKNPYIDLHASLWATRNNLHTHTSGGYPREPYYFSSPTPEEKLLQGILRNTSLTHSDGKRWGISLSNKFKLHERLDLTLMGNYQRESLTSKDNWWNDPIESDIQKSRSRFRSRPRDGWHKQWDTAFRFDWQPTDWLSISAGARKNGYSAFDRQLDRGRKAQDSAYAANGAEYRYVNWKIPAPDDLKQAWQNHENELAQIKADEDTALQPLEAWRNQEEQKLFDTMCAGKTGSERTDCEDDKYGWDEYWNLDNEFEERAQPIRDTFTPRKNDTYQRYYNFIDHNPRYSRWRQNGNFGGGKYYEGGDIQGGNPAAYDDYSYQWDASERDGKFHKEDSPVGNGMVGAENGYDVKIGAPGTHDTAEKFPQVKKVSAVSDWQPVIAVTVNPTANSRVYARFAKTTRMPSIFESTVGFSAKSPSIYPLRPERATNIEFGYAHDLSSLLKAEQADIKLVYYRNTIKDVIDRTPEFNFRNIEAQKVAGIELQSRYDNGRFFADFSATYNLKNEVCDESSAIFLDPMGRIPNCLKDGPPASYLHNMTPPKYSLNLTLGARFFNHRLEVGSRILHHAGLRNHDDENYGALKTEVQHSGNNFNVPIYWGKVTTFDAWISYRFRNGLNAEMVVTNLTDQYYLDPLTRTHNPAPGRTFRIGVSKKF